MFLFNVENWETISDHARCTDPRNQNGGWRLVSHPPEPGWVLRGMERLVDKLSWDHMRKCPVPARSRTCCHSDHVGDVRVKLLAVEGYYDPRRAARTTFIHMVASRYLASMARQCLAGRDVPLPEILPYDPVSAMEEASDFRQRLRQISQEAGEVVRLVARSSRELFAMVRAGRVSEGQELLTRRLTKLGWDPGRIEGVFVEIETALRQALR